MDFFSSQIRCSVGYLRKGITYKEGGMKSEEESIKSVHIAEGEML